LFGINGSSDYALILFIQIHLPDEFSCIMLAYYSTSAVQQQFSAARSKSTCSNRLAIKQESLEHTILEALRVSLNREETRTEAADLLRGLIDKIVLMPKAFGTEYAIDLPEF